MQPKGIFVDIQGDVAHEFDAGLQLIPAVGMKLLEENVHTLETRSYYVWCIH